MNTKIVEAIKQLEVKGWTTTALAEELGVIRLTVWRWREGQREPANAGPVLASLRQLERRRRVPKKRRVRKR